MAGLRNRPHSGLMHKARSEAEAKMVESMKHQRSTDVAAICKNQHIKHRAHHNNLTRPGHKGGLVQQDALWRGVCLCIA